MKILILAAGQGSRLAPYTNEMPKCMVSYQGKPIIDHILQAVKETGITSIGVIGGYKSDVLKKHLNNIKHEFFVNKDFASTNMVATLFCAQKALDSDVIVSYSDIAYSSDILNALIKSEADISVVIDKAWKELWLQRMDNPLKDAETLKLDDDGFIKEIGKKPISYSEIEGQYIGLIKLSKKILPEIISVYRQLPKDLVYDGKNYDNMFMTSFLQILISKDYKLKPVFINGGWIEIDSPEDLECFPVEV